MFHVVALLPCKHVQILNQSLGSHMIKHTVHSIHCCNCRMFEIITRLQYVEIKCQLDATEVFIADLIVCSTCFGHHYAHHQELKSITQWLLPVVFGAVVFKLLVWCGAEGYVSGLQDAAISTY